jgi:hypothetical protein
MACVALGGSGWLAFSWSTKGRRVNGVRAARVRAQGGRFDRRGGRGRGAGDEGRPGGR